MKKYKHSISVTETIIEFLNIILCLFSPFNIPTIVFETKNIEFKPSYEVSEIYGEDIVTGAKLLNKKTGEEEELSLSAVFIAVGMEPQSEFIKGLVDTDKTGYIIATEDCRTSMDKVYAVGDIRTKSLRQVVTAVADGAVAITSIEQDTK